MYARCANVAIVDHDPQVFHRFRVTQVVVWKRPTGDIPEAPYGLIFPHHSTGVVKAGVKRSGRAFT